MKKILVVLLSSLLLTGCSSVVKLDEEVKTDSETMTVNVVINDVINDKELFNENVSVEKVETLEEFLKTQKAFEVKMSTGEFGGQIDGMMGLDQDFSKGPWWVYESNNNAQCVEAGYCDGISNLKIADGDNFTFNYIESFE